MTTPEKRKLILLLVIPLFIIALAALSFYALGGGTADARTAASSQGINTQLPAAQLPKRGTVDKFSLYQQAARDGAAAEAHPAADAFAALGWDTPKFAKRIRISGAPVSVTAQEAQIKEKLAAINRQISQPQPVVQPVGAAGNDGREALDRMEKLLQQKQQSPAADPEMAQLNAMLDKIQQIQNPALVQAQLKASAEKRVPDSAFKAIPAVIDGNQKVLNGGVVRLRLSDSVRIGSYLLLKGQPLSGACTITNQRLLLVIQNIRLGTSIIPVNLTVFSLDGMPGIAAPEAELGEAAGGGTADALAGMDFLPAGYSVGAQAATAGISAAKGLLGKKVRRVRVKLHGGQAILLRVNKS